MKGEKMPAGNIVKIKIFADGADLKAMKDAYAQGTVQGFTTNPTLMRKANVKEYVAFAMQALAEIPDLPISFEVFSDEFSAMAKEARTIAGWGKNVYVKIPVSNAKGESSVALIKELASVGMQLNVTAVFTIEQVKNVVAALNPKVRSIVSVFAGRIADTGRDPVPYMKEAARIVQANPRTELLWASSRELLNIFQAQECGCHIITVTPEILSKVSLINKDLQELSLETVRKFLEDARFSGYRIT